MESQKRTCRLCFKTCENFQAIETNTFDVLYKIQLKINLAISEEPLMCTSCAEMLKNSLDFKTMCAHNYAASFRHKDENVKLDLNKVYLSKKENGFLIPEDQAVCGFCMGLVEKCSVASLNYENVNVMLKTCLPELDFSIIDTPIICGPCQESLRKCFHFMKNCLTVEEKIEKYCEAEGINSEGFIELTDVREYTSTNTLKSEEGINKFDIMKEFKTFCEDEENSDDEMKHNEGSLMEVAAQQFLSNNTLVCKEEGNEAEMINKAETIYMETDIKVEHKYEEFEELEDQKLINVDESLMEVQDQKLNNVQQLTPELEYRKCLIVEDIEIKTEQSDFDSLQSEDTSSRPREGIQLHRCCGSLPEQYQCESCLIQTKCKKDIEASETPTCQRKICGLTTKYKSAQCKCKKLIPSEKKMFQCASCPYQTKRKLGLREHVLIHKKPSEIEMHQCESCPFKTKYRRCLHRHMLTHKDVSEIKMYQCNCCDFKTKHRGCLIGHMLVHKDPSEVIMYQCESCDFKTKRKYSMTMHMLTHKDPSEITMYKCESCTFSTENQNNLHRHMLSHKDPSEIGMYQCASCSFHSKHRHCLDRHMVVHKDPSEIEMHQCTSCDFKTKYKNSLRDHMLTHKLSSETTMYKCTSCSFQTKLKQSLNRHLLIHKDPSEIKMFHCDMCSYKSKHKRCLHVHLLTHKDPSEIKVYHCESCSFKTKYKNRFHAHILIHKSPLEITIHQCESCSFKASRKQDLLEHMSLTHKIPT